MSGFESVMWELERDPQLSSAFANLTMFDRPPDRERLRRKMARATLAVPRLRQRVVTSANPLERPAGSTTRTSTSTATSAGPPSAVTATSASSTSWRPR